MKKKKQNSHGGARPGAGRPAGEATVRLTVPAALVPDIMKLINTKTEQQ